MAGYFYLRSLVLLIVTVVPTIVWHKSGVKFSTIVSCKACPIVLIVNAPRPRPKTDANVGTKLTRNTGVRARDKG